MRIGIDIRELERGRQTGIGRFVRDFIRYASLARPHHRFFLYGNQRTDPPAAGANVAVRLRPERLTLWWDQVVLPRLAGADRVEVFLSPYIKGPVGVRCPLVVTAHDLLFLALPPADWQQWLRNALFVQLARRVARRADLVLADSEHSRGDILRFLNPDPHKVRVLPLAVGEEYRPVRERDELERVWARYGVTSPYVLYVGNFKPHKNVQTLLRAFALLGEQQPRLQLVLAGRLDHWADERQRLAIELGIAARVRFTGAVAADDLPALYSGAGVFAFPSLYEGFGLPPLEAMSCGTPVVVGNCTSLPEVVGQAGVLVDPEDAVGLAAALGCILEDGQERRRLGELGLARADLFRPPVIYERQLRALEGLGSGG